MGCNYFCESFPEVEYTIFYDDIVPKVNDNTTIITNVEHYRNKNKKCYDLCHTHKKTEFYTINKIDSEFSDGDSRLNFCIHTPSIALNWAWKKGFKNVVLAGIDLGTNLRHFDYSSTPDNDNLTINNSDMIKARQHLTDVASRYLNIYQLNPNSDLEIEKIEMGNL